MHLVTKPKIGVRRAWDWLTSHSSLLTLIHKPTSQLQPGGGAQSSYGKAYRRLLAEELTSAEVGRGRAHSLIRHALVVLKTGLDGTGVAYRQTPSVNINPHNSWHGSDGLIRFPKLIRSSTS